MERVVPRHGSASCCRIIHHPVMYGTWVRHESDEVTAGWFSVHRFFSSTSCRARCCFILLRGSPVVAVAAAHPPSAWFFYAWLKPVYILLLVWSTCVDFTCGNLIYGPLAVDRAHHPATRWHAARINSCKRKIVLVRLTRQQPGRSGFFQICGFARDNVQSISAGCPSCPAHR